MLSFSSILVMVGQEPTTWYDTKVRQDGNIWMSGQTTTHVAADGFTFIDALARSLFDLFDRTRNAATPKASDVLVCSRLIDKSILKTTDVLGYVCASAAQSIIKQVEPAAWQAAAGKAQRDHAGTAVAGMCIPAEKGVISEVYLPNGQPNVADTAFTLFHEFMHNKTRFATGEDINWVHTRGGGGLAKPGTGLRGMTDETAKIMHGRLSLQNKQYLATGIGLRGL